MRRRYSRTIAIFLLLALSLHGGLRLWMHHWLHESKTASFRTIPGAATIQLADDCINDAMLPLQEATIFTIAVPVQKATELGQAPQPPTADTETIYYSLKGPPPSSLFAPDLS